MCTYTQTQTADTVQDFTISPCKEIQIAYLQYKLGCTKNPHMQPTPAYTIEHKLSQAYRNGSCIYLVLSETACTATYT